MATSVVHARLAATVSLLALSLGAPALAQTTPPAEQATTVEDIIVTAQKREESIQDVPVAISAFSAENLDAMKIEGGSELLRAVPNVSFSKNNFSMYNFSIRGIGTKAISAASDPAVAVSFNNSPLIRNRLFEQEYLDVNRVEVLRGPQGTLYGRNATAGVVNMIPNMPGPDFEAFLKAETGNYGSMRGQMMVNIPLTDTLWLRAAAGLTKREGFDHNTFNDTRVNGRDLYSTRLSAAWEPSDRFNVNLIWEHFGEDDNRSRTGKQLCATDAGPSSVGGIAVTSETLRGRMSQGCRPVSLYDDAAYGVPNGAGMSQIYLGSAFSLVGMFTTPLPATRKGFTFITPDVDPYAGLTQSRNLREISTSYDPIFRAENDIFQLNINYDISDSLKFISQTAYSEDSYYSSQDYTRYVTNEIFNDSSKIYNRQGVLTPHPMTPGGFYNDPQLGLSNRMLSVDLSKSENNQIYQEFRLQSSFDSRFNFNVGANYMKFKTQDDYYVFSNLFSFLAEAYYNGASSNRIPIECTSTSSIECIYVDPNRLSDINGDGHNYFRSKNQVETESWAIFGEAYVDVRDDLKLTVGLRYTDDTKVTTPYPSQLLLGVWSLLGYGPSSGGKVSRGYPADEIVKQNWDALTGRAVIDWKVNDDLMVYASYSRGYKGGGTNPPRADIDPTVIQYMPLASTFDPEYVNAIEIGAKGQYFDGRVRLNATAFYYDYKDYQVSQIVDRISLNENFDAKSMGLELEGVYQVTPNFRLDANFGLLKTKIDSGEKSIDVMNRTQGNPDWMVLRPWLQVPSNCIAPKKYVEKILSVPSTNQWNALTALCGGSARSGSFTPDITTNFKFYEQYGFTYNPFKDAENAGKGFYADLSGNELPNAPRWTANIGAQYTWFYGAWEATIRADYYKQANSYFRVYNTEYDRIRSWDNANVSVSIENASTGLRFGAYVKNIFNDTSIVDAFTNSDDSMLTTNVFVTDPRLFGVNISKSF
ncbi:TonB-dependent receptor [Brevundimonas faecalis]|uniref:Iron complex outermembrane receptor protein n=1 Tax=Brevundimonas faecalis TaxID=947378 RepID=A0ABV2R6C1_9CAUL